MAEQALNSKEHQELVERLAELARSEMPLPEGLRAAAQETGSRRLAGQLKTLAGKFESGANWEAALEHSDKAIQPCVLGVLRAGIRAGNLADALDSLLDQDRVYRDTCRRLFSTLAYPALLLAATMGLLLFAILLIVPPMKEIFIDFGTELPQSTQLWIRSADVLPRIMLVSGVGILLALIAIRLIGGPSGWMRFVSFLPILGPMIHFAGVAQMLRLLQVMLANKMPLPEALRLTSSGVSNPNVQLVTRWLADEVEAGKRFSDLIESTPRLPASIVPVIRWGENNSSLDEAMRNAYELLEGRIRLRGSLLNVLLGPLMLIIAGLAIGSLTVSMFMPLVSLIQNLT